MYYLATIIHSPAVASPRTNATNTASGTAASSGYGMLK